MDIKKELVKLHKTAFGYRYMIVALALLGMIIIGGAIYPNGQVIENQFFSGTLTSNIPVNAPIYGNTSNAISLSYNALQFDLIGGALNCYNCGSGSFPDIFNDINTWSASQQFNSNLYMGEQNSLIVCQTINPPIRCNEQVINFQPNDPYEPNITFGGYINVDPLRDPSINFSANINDTQNATIDQGLTVGENTTLGYAISPPQGVFNVNSTGAHLYDGIDYSLTVGDDSGGTPVSISDYGYQGTGNGDSIFLSDSTSKHNINITAGDGDQDTENITIDGLNPTREEDFFVVNSTELMYKNGKTIYIGIDSPVVLNANTVYSNSYASGSSTGQTKTVTVQNTLTTTCTMVFTSGLLTGGTCP